MKRAACLTMATMLVLGVGLMTAGCQEQPKPTTPVTPPAAAAAIAQKTCPVMGNPIDPNIYVDYKDRRVYFCCAMCPAEFQKDPEKYIAKLDESLKAAPPAAPAPAAPKAP